MTTSGAERQPVLEARAIVKRFPGVLALDRVNFQIYAGEVHGLIGENGAGKSTLMHILAGAQQPDDGQILLDGQCVEFANTREALDERISIVYQELNLIPYLTVAENVFLGRELCSATGLIDSREQNRRCAELLEELDPAIDPRAEVNSLRVGQQQIVEVAKALNSRARVIFMDEPTSAISDQEIEVLFSIIDSLTRDGISIVYVSHKLDELLRISDRITVLRDGRLVRTLSTKEADHDTIVRLMVGRELTDLFVRGESRLRGELFRVDNLSQESVTSGPRRVDGVSFAARAGEVLGIFGLMGAGRTELLESIFGLRPRQTSGAVFVGGKECTIRSPGDAMRHGIGLVPEDRKREGLVLQLSVQQNISLSCLAQMERGLLLNGRAERSHADKYVERFAIRTPSVRRTVRSLSGGNQQKVVLAKVLSSQPRVLLLDEPTRGIDVNAKREIYGLIDELKHQNLAIVVVSSELPEILGIADRIMVMCEGRKTAEFGRTEATEQAVMRAAVPGAFEHA